MKGQPTLRDIAEKAGCHHTTVSLALRHHSSIPLATAERIARLAEEMGYKPNPFLSAWMANVRVRRSGRYKATLAYLDVLKGSSPHFLDYFHGANRRADELGYKLDYFRLYEQGMTQRRMDRILHNSGIRGVIISPVNVHGHLSLAWNNLAAIAIGHTMLRPQLHRVVHAQFRGIQTAIRNITKRGYRRIGLIWSQQVDARTNYHYSSLLARYQQTIPAADRVPIFYPDSHSDADLQRWHSRWRPDCLLGISSMHARFMDVVGPGIVDLDLSERSIKGLAGIDQQYERIGAAAVDLVCADLSINRIGIPESPFTLLIDGRWVEGSTLPERPRTVYKKQTAEK